MTTFKRLAALALSACTALALSGCADSKKNESSAALNESDVTGDVLGGGYFAEGKNIVFPIYNAEDKEIGSFECEGYLGLANGCVLYARYPDDNAGSKKAREFGLYNIEKAEDHRLGIVENYQQVSHNQIIEADGHLYVSVAWGDLNDRESCGLTFYDIDLSEYSMTPILTIEQGFMHNSYTIVNNKLIVAEVLQHAQTDLVVCDLSEKRSSPIVHKYDESDFFTEDAIRHIDADDNNIYMLRLVGNKTENNSVNFATSLGVQSGGGQTSDNSEKVSLYLDTYDFDYKLKSSVDISDFCVSTDVERTEGSKISEWKKMVRHFFVHNGLVYYHNFSTTNAIGVLKNGSVDRLFEVNSLFRYVNGSGEGSDLFVQIYDDDKDKRNTLYLVDPETYEVKTARFFAPDTRYDFFSALRYGDKILLTMGHLQDNGNDVYLPERLYYLDMNDLDFKAAE